MIPISIKLLGGSISVDISQQDTIWMLKKKIQETYHYPIWAQTLFDIREEPLVFKDESTIMENRIEDEIGLWIWSETRIPPVSSVLEHIVSNHDVLEHCHLKKGDQVAFQLKLLGPKQYIYCPNKHKMYHYYPDLYSNSMVVIEARKDKIKEKMLHIPSGMMIRGILDDISVTTEESNRIDIHLVIGKPYSIYDEEGRQVFQQSIEEDNWLLIRYDNIV